MRALPLAKYYVAIYRCSKLEALVVYELALLKNNCMLSFILIIGGFYEFNKKNPIGTRWG